MKRKSFPIIAALLSLVFMMTTGGWAATSSGPVAKGTNVIAASDPSKLPASAKQRTDTLIVGSSAWNGEFNPIINSSTYDAWATTLIFDSGLMTNDDNGNPKLWMAKDYAISKDGKTYTFHLNKGIKYSNGDPVTAQDFYLTYAGIADPKYDGLRTDAVDNLVGYAEYHKGYAPTLNGVKVIDDYTISFTESTIKASALLQDFGYQPMDHKIYAFKKGNYAFLKTLYNKAMGAGPYKLVENKPSQTITFVRNESYWRGTPKIANIIMKYTTSANNIQELSTGGTDIDSIAAKPSNITMLKNPGFLNLNLYPANAYTYIGFNLRDPMLSDKNVRQALTYGLNREGFTKAYFEQYGAVCNAPVSIVSWAYTDKVNQYNYDPKKAAALLDKAGWKLKSDGWRYNAKGQKLTLHFATSSGSQYADTLIPIMEENWKAIGVELIPELMEFSTLCDKVYKARKFQMYSMSWSLSIDPDPSGIFSIAQDIVGGSNSVGWHNDKSEALMKAGLVETNQAKRTAIYQQWVQLANEELPYLFLTQGDAMIVSSCRVKNFHVGPYRDWTYDIDKTELAQ